MNYRTLVSKISSSIALIYEKVEADQIAKMVLEDFGFDRNTLLLNKPINFTVDQTQNLDSIISKLQNEEPIQHILGYAWFVDRKYIVNREVLIPRQETEELVHLVADENLEPGLKILDIGTGSGCIGISLALMMNEADVHASDVSEGALGVAKQNAKTHQVDLNFHQGDILKNFPEVDELDIIVCNPPYISAAEMVDIQKNVIDFEPHLALFISDNSPLIFYHKVSEWAQTKLKRDGKLYFEINEGYGPEMEQLLAEYSFEQIRIIDDLNGKARIATATK
ncbi:MAG: peptide chain release factor N(5)-glutamine methyltransferase [Cyclobacteriaceae bacterium]